MVTTDNVYVISKHTYINELYARSECQRYFDLYKKYKHVKLQNIVLAYLSLPNAPLLQLTCINNNVQWFSVNEYDI